MNPKPKTTPDTPEEFEASLAEKSAAQWADLQKLALHLFLGGGRHEIVQLLDELDFPTETYRRLFTAFREHWRVFKNADPFEIHHAVAGQRWYEELGGLQWVLQTLILPDSSAFHRGTVDRVVGMMKELRAHNELGAMQALLEESGPGDIGAVLSELRARARRAEEILPRSADLSVSRMAEALRDREVLRVPTGFERMDDALSGGIRHGALFVIAARPGVGKTTIALNIAAKNAAAGRRTLFVSLEMTREEIAERYIAGYADCSAEDARKNADTILPMLEGDLLIDDATRTLDGLKAIVMRNSDCDLFVIDYLQLLSAPSKSGRDVPRIQEISLITRELKILARDIERPVIMLCQMSRAIERDRHNREPVLADLRESGTIEQDSDYVSFLWNRNAKAQEQATGMPDLDGTDDDDTETEPDIRWILRKNRFGPADRSFAMDFRRDHSLFLHKPMGGKKKNPDQQKAF